MKKSLVCHMTDKRPVTLIAIAVDRSASMGEKAGLPESVISGTNEFVISQDPARNPSIEKTKTIVGTVLFNTTAKWVRPPSQEPAPAPAPAPVEGTNLYRLGRKGRSAVPYVAQLDPYYFQDITEYQPLTSATYVPSGCTALYDAVEACIRGADLYQADHQDEDVKVIVVIQTDGQENSSRRLSRDKLRELISNRSERGWQFTFLGADQDACLSAESIGIAKGSAMAYRNDADGTTCALRTMSEAIQRYRSADPELATPSVEYTQLERDANESAVSQLQVPPFPGCPLGTNALSHT